MRCIKSGLTPDRRNTRPLAHTSLAETPATATDSLSVLLVVITAYTDVWRGHNAPTYTVPTFNQGAGEKVGARVGIVEANGPNVICGEDRALVHGLIRRSSSQTQNLVFAAKN